MEQQPTTTSTRPGSSPTSLISAVNSMRRPVSASRTYGRYAGAHSGAPGLRHLPRRVYKQAETVEERSNNKTPGLTGPTPTGMTRHQAPRPGIRLFTHSLSDFRGADQTPPTPATPIRHHQGSEGTTPAARLDVDPTGPEVERVHQPAQAAERTPHQRSRHSGRSEPDRAVRRCRTMLAGRSALSENWRLHETVLPQTRHR